MPHIKYKMPQEHQFNKFLKSLNPCTSDTQCGRTVVFQINKKPKPFSQKNKINLTCEKPIFRNNF